MNVSRLTMAGMLLAAAAALLPTGSLSLAEADQGRMERITGKDGAPMMSVPAGEFLYGEGNHSLSLPAFYMDRYEVTTKLYAKFLRATGRKEPSKWSLVSLRKDGDRPVIGVDWHDADAYCRYYGKRLPTEQEWEKAARGTDGRIYPWGDEQPAPSLASYDWDGKRLWQGYGTLSPVGSYEAGRSPYGIEDLAGNVTEWTGSDYDKSSKVVRGGSWLVDARTLRASHRHGVLPLYRLNVIGFRCVQDVK